MIAAVKDIATGAATRTARRLAVRGGIFALTAVGVVGYRYVTGLPPLFAAGAEQAEAVAPAAPAATMPAAPAPVVVAAPQAAPDLNAPRRAAQGAADATNAATAAKTGQAVPAPAAAGQPGAPAPRSGPASVPAVPARPAAADLAANVPPVTREVFTYSADGRRDPFYSLILTEDLRPLLSDLKLVGILYESSGRRSVAIMRDVLTNAQYRVGTGQTLGRMRVTQIKQKGVIFSIDEFGLSRQDSLVLTDTTRVRN